MPSAGLILALQHEQELDDATRAELVNLIASLTNWSNRLGLGGGNIKLPGLASFAGQPWAKVFQNHSSGQSIPDSTETVVTWAPAALSSPQEEGDPYDLFDGTSYFILTEPGTYLVMAHLSFDASATGYRVLGIHPGNKSGTDYFNRVHQVGALVGGNGMEVMAVVRVPPLSEVTPVVNVNPLKVGVMVYQSSGGPLTVGSTQSTFEVYKMW